MTTNTEAKRQELILIYSDFHKEAFGFRPRYDYRSMTLEQLEADFNHFDSVCESNNRDEEARIARSKAAFESRIQTIINMGANDRPTALRWIVDSYEDDMWCNYDFEGLVHYHLDLGYGDYAKGIIKEMELAVRC